MSNIKTQSLHFNSSAFEETEKKLSNLNDADNPSVNVYFNFADKNVAGIIVFNYSESALRNYAFEQEVKFNLEKIGGVTGKNNKVIFSKKNFFTRTINNLQNFGYKLFWGKDNKRISSYTVKSSISYGMDWFGLSGTIQSDFGEYKLSDVVKLSRGKNYVELDDKIYFLPDALKNLSAVSKVEDDKINLPKTSLRQINDFAFEYGISSESYLKNFLNFKNYDLELRKIFCGELKSYQKFGAAWIFNLYKNNFGAYLADDMGLGKTIQAIAFICSQGRNFKKPVLIVSPKTVLYNWQNEFSKFAPSQRICVVYGNKFSDSFEDGDTVYLTTYETVVAQQEIFLKLNFDSIIIDEVQYIKNLRTQRYQALKKLNSHFKLALSGTPIENNLEEFWTIFDLLNPGLLGSLSKFMSQYQAQENNLERLRKIIKPFFLRREKDSVLPDLPARNDEYIFCEMEESQCELYEKILSAAKKDIASLPSHYEIKDNAIILQALLYLREVCSEPKLLPPELQIPCKSCKFEVFKEYSQRIMKSGNDKLVVYSLFPRVLQNLQKWSEEKNWKTFYIDGTTTNRQKIIDDFENSASGIFFISLKAGGVGINLISCQYVIIYDTWWNSAVEEQAAARIYRVGQTKPVFIYHFLVRNTVEEKICHLQQLKNELSQSVIKDADNPQKFSITDIVKLIFN